MIFRDWLEAQYKSGRLDREEIEKAVDELIEKESNEENNNNLR